MTATVPALLATNDTKTPKRTRPSLVRPRVLPQFSDALRMKSVFVKSFKSNICGITPLTERLHVSQASLRRNDVRFTVHSVATVLSAIESLNNKELAPAEDKELKTDITPEDGACFMLFNKEHPHNEALIEALCLKAKLLCTLGWRMASCGAETRLIIQSVKTMAHDLGCRSIDLSLTREGIVVKLRLGQFSHVEFQEIKHFAINMDSLERLNRICIRVHNGELSDPKKIFLAIRAVRPRHYNRRQLIFIEAIAGACFAYLNGGSMPVCVAALFGGIVLMYFRFLFIRQGFFEAFAFMMAAFTGSLTAFFVAHYGFNTTAEETILASIATTLLLVPGFPLINGFLDIFKGYVPVGVSRLIIAATLVVAAAIGLLATAFIVTILNTILALY